MLLILSAALLAAVGGHLFLNGVLGVSRALRVSKAIVATTLAAFATSSPEFTVSTIAAAAGQPALGFGDALGSNVVNIALILGLALLIKPMPVERDQFGLTYILALLVPLLTLGAAVDGWISGAEGGLFLLIFLAWLMGVARRAWKSREPEPSEENGSIWLAVFLLAAGLGLLIGAGRLFVEGASGVAADIGMDIYVVGVLIVALGTSLPELTTTLYSRFRGHDDIGLGTLLGSNLFNGLAIAGTAAAISPIPVTVSGLMVALFAGVLSLLLLGRVQHASLGRTRGAMLLLVYIIFVGLTLSGGRVS